MYFKVIKSGTNRKLVYDLLLVVYSKFCRITHRFEKFDMKQSNDFEICPRSLTVVSSESCRVAMYVKCSEDSERMKRKIAIFNDPTLISRPLSSEPRRISAWTLYCEKLPSVDYILVADSVWVALQIFEQFCPKAGDANQLVAEPETDFIAKCPFTVIQGHLFRYH